MTRRLADQVLRGTAVVAAAAVATSVAGCSQEQQSDTAPSRTTVATPTMPPRFDPPTRFDATASWALPSAQNPDDDLETMARGGLVPAIDRITVAGPMVFTANRKALTALRVDTTSTAWTLSPRTPVQEQGEAGRPLTATVGGRAVILAAFPVLLPGHGTAAEQPGVELLAADPSTGHTVWDDVHALPDLGSDVTLWKSKVGATVLAADDRAVTIRLDNDGRAAGALVVDPSQHRIRWFDRTFLPDLVTKDGIVVGKHAATATTAMARTQDGALKWKTDNVLSVSPAGPGLAALQINDVTSTDAADDDNIRVVDADSGKPAPGWPTIRAATCAHDGATTTVCHGRASGHVSAYDTATGRRLWTLPRGGRTAPRVTAVWHGAVYGTSDNGPVVLDARTGQDRQTAPGVQALAVSAYGAIGLDQQNEPRFYPAVG